MNEEKIGLQQKGHFSHPGQKGRSLSTSRGLSVHVPAFINTFLSPPPRQPKNPVSEAAEQRAGQAEEP